MTSLIRATPAPPTGRTSSTGQAPWFLRAYKIHMFDQLCEDHSIKHKLTKFRHPWTNGQVEIMNKKIKSHTTKKYYYESVESLKKHLLAYLLAYNFQRPLKGLKYKSPYEKMIEIYEQTPDLFNNNPHQKIVGLNI